MEKVSRSGTYISYKNNLYVQPSRLQVELVASNQRLQVPAYNTFRY